MKGVIPWKSMVAAGLLALAAAPVMAQNFTIDAAAANDTLRARFDRAMHEGLGRLAVSYWEPRLNAYKVRIDEIFAGRDLVHLNELRARFSIVMERMENEKKKEEERARAYQERRMEDTTQVVATPAVEQDESVATVVDTLVVAAPEAQAEPDAVDTVDAARLQAERERQYQEDREHRMDLDEQALARGETLNDEDGGEYRDITELPAIARWLARGYRPGLDNLGDVVRMDLAAFTDSLASFSLRFEAEHAEDLARLPELREQLISYTEEKEMRRQTNHPRVFMAAYREKIEPMVLLYSGELLSRLIGSVAGSHAPDALPEHPMLAGNSPNPASNSTTITYTLPETSSGTTLRLFDARGETVMEVDEGTKEAGDHSVAVDVSKLHSGWYMYQLKAGLRNGEQISSRIMQVTK